MATFGEIVSRVSRRLIDASNTAVDVADVKAAINQGQGYWKVRRFWFNEVSDTATLTAGNADFPFPSSTCLFPSYDHDGFYIEYGGVRYPVSKLLRPEYDAVFTSNTEGRPRYYANVSGAYKCFPTPDQDYMLGRHYLKQYTDLDADDDSNDFTVNADRLLMLYALMTLSAELRQDMPMANYYQAAMQQEFNNLNVRNNALHSSGELVLDSAI